MRIAFVGTGDPDLDRFPPGGGIEHQVWTLAEELARRSHDVTILTRDRSADIAPGLRLQRIPMRGRGQVLAKMPMGWRARKAIEAVRPDVVYLSEKWVSYFPSHLDLPLIYATHNKDAFETYRSFGYQDHVVNRVFFDVKRRIEEGEMRRAHVIAANSRGVLDYVRGRGFTHAELLPMASDGAAFRNEQEEAPPYVYASGQLLPVKGMRILVDAFVRVAPDHPDWRLVIGGRGPERTQLEAQVQASGFTDRVTLLPWLERDAYISMMARAAIFVLPSFAETFGTVILDAMSSGRPVIATDIDGPRDVVEDGKTGRLVPAGDVERLAEALRVLMSDPAERARLGAAAYAKSRQAHTAQAAADAFERLARVAIERHRANSRL